MTQDFKMYRNANVEAYQDGKCLKVVIDGTATHTFNASSRLSKALVIHTPDELAARLDNGSFFFVGDSLIDFQDGQYDGFIHTDDDIAKLMEHIGVRAGGRTSRRETQSTTQGNLILNNIHSVEDFHVQGYAEGGAFTSQLSYSWSPFRNYIRGVFNLVRQICANGMVGTSQFFNGNIPMVNRWEEHMQIATRQIQHKIQSQVSTRMNAMGAERASVAEAQAIASHAFSRYKTTENMKDLETLLAIFRVASPELHLSENYTSDVFNNNAVARQLPSHLTAFDAWNLVTEMYSHTDEVEQSSGAALQKIANAMVFDNKRNMYLTDTKQIATPFGDPDVAFFGKLAF